ncbi:MAG TPA: AMP-binding protein [Burkholderiaceae bacterium]|jgi:fatty-acyl-CoA synthase
MSAAATPQPPRPGSTLASLLDEMAAARGSHPAIIHFGERIGYAELRERAREAARALLALGVKRGDRVGALLGNQPEWLIMCFAASHVGATFVPLNTWYKKAELGWTLRHCEVSLLVMLPRFLNQDFAGMLLEMAPELPGAASGRLRSVALPALRAVVMLGEPVRGAFDWRSFIALGASVDAASVDAAARAVSARDHAFILYTSGSLAEPKGVLLDHGGVVQNGHAMAMRRAIDGSDRIWLGSPLFYGLGAANAMPVALTQGATLVLQGSFDAGSAIEVIEATEATAWYGTGNMTRAVLDHPEYRQRRIGSLKKGNAGTMTDYKRMTLVEMGISRACPAYGLTESYGNATVGEADDALEAKLHTNGRPLPGTEMRIVDPATNAPLAAGQVGLVLLRGHTTPGYYANPEETRRALRADGFFDTGDLGCLDADGRFVFHSRLKEVIKSGGINVSPMEVEQLLAQHPHVREAYVVGVSDVVRGERIVAFVDADRPLPEDELKAFVKERVSSFKVPHHVFFRAEAQLPRLASGKVAKYRLVEEAKRELGL